MGAGAKPILIVDDNPEVRQVLVELVELEGYRVVTAESGLGALLRIGRDDPACLVLDLKLQDVSGFQIHRTLRSDPEFERLPVLLISGAYVNEEWVRRQAGEGPVRFLPKPVSPEDLASALRQLLA